MKKKILSAILFFAAIACNPIKSEASYILDGHIYAGEEAREFYYDEFLLDYEKQDMNLDNKIRYNLDKLSIEYFILSDIVAWTDGYVMINGACDDRTYIDFSADLAIQTDDLSLKITNISDNADLLNGDISYKDISTDFNIWWASLGSNYKDYIYIFRNINNQTRRCNNLIDQYNRVNGTNYDHISYLNDFYKNISYSECIERYKEAGKCHNWNLHSDFYPQGSYIDWVNNID